MNAKTLKVRKYPRPRRSRVFASNDADYPFIDRDDCFIRSTPFMNEVGRATGEVFVVASEEFVVHVSE